MKKPRKTAVKKRAKTLKDAAAQLAIWKLAHPEAVPGVSQKKMIEISIDCNSIFKKVR